MLGEYSHTKSESLAQIRTTMAEYSIFARGLLFLLAHPVHVNYASILCRFRVIASYLSKLADFNLPYLHLASA